MMASGRRAAALSLAILLVGTLCLVLFSRPAAAQTPLAPPTSTTVLPCVPPEAFPVIDPARVCPPGLGAPVRVAESRAERDEKPPTGMLGGLTGDRVGRFPDDHYDLGYDEGAWNNFGAKLRGSFADMFFGASRVMASVGNWFIEFAYDLGFVKLLSPVAEKMAAGYNATVVGGVQLRHLALTVAVVYAAWVALRGRVAHGLGELGLSMVLAVLGVLFLANPGGYLTGAFDNVGRFTQAVMVVGSDDGGDQGVDGVVLPMRQRLQQTLIAEPYDLLNWGASLDGTPCAAVRDEILATGPHGTSDKPREMMAATPGCERYADWNHDATWERVGGAFLVMGGTFWVVALLVTVAGSVLLAQFMAAGIVAISPFAAVALILPAGARGLGWKLVTGFLASMVAVVAMSVLLAVGLRGLVAVLDVTDGGILPRFTLFLVMALALNMARKKFAAAGKSMAAKAGERLSAVRIAGAGGGSWVVPSTASASWALPGGAFMAAKAHQSKDWAVRHHRDHRQAKQAASKTVPEDVDHHDASGSQPASASGARPTASGGIRRYGPQSASRRQAQASGEQGPRTYGGAAQRSTSAAGVKGAEVVPIRGRPAGRHSPASVERSASETRVWPPPRRPPSAPPPTRTPGGRPPVLRPRPPSRP